MAAAKPEKSVSPHRLAERKRRRRELIAVGVAGATLVAFVFAQTELPPLTRHTSLVSNLAVISLFNLSFLLLGLMLFLVGRNLAKVIFERRRGLIGSKFQVRLVAGFIAVALIPSAFLLYVSGVFLHADINSWFNPEYEQILNDSLEIAKTYYLNSANNASHFARVWPSRSRRRACSRLALAEQIAAQGLLAPGKHEQLKDFINRQQEEYNLGTIEVFSADRKLLLIDISPKTPTGIGASPDSPIISQTLKGQTLTRTDRLGSADVIRGSAPIYVSNETDNVLGAVLVDYYLPQSLATRATNISRVSRGLLPAANPPPAHHEQLPADAGADRARGRVAGELVRNLSLARNHRPDQNARARHSGHRRWRSQFPHPGSRRRRDRPAGRFVQPDDRRPARFRRRARAPPPVHRDPVAQRVGRRRRPRPRRRRHRHQSMRRTAARPQGAPTRSAATTRARFRRLSPARSTTCSPSRRARARPARPSSSKWRAPRPS